MAGRLQKEIKQAKPFGSLEEEAALNLWKASEELQQAFVAVLKPYRLSNAQYNLLRILRGAGKDGLACGEIGARLITHDPDITRLGDRLEARSLLTRSRENKDRRVVITRITEEGLRILKALDEPVAKGLVARLGHLGQARLQQLIDLLEETRGTRK